MIAHLGIVLAVAATVTFNVGFMLEKRALEHLPAIDVQHSWQLLRTLFAAPAWLAGFVADLRRPVPCRLWCCPWYR